MTIPEITIDWALFHQAFDIDEQYHNPYFIDRYLEKDSGAILFIYKEDSDARMEGGDPLENKEMKELVKENPDNYLEIIGQSHGERHDILLEFIESNWTEDEDLKMHVRSKYHKSIGWWIKEVRNDPELEKQSENIIESYFQFLTDTIEREKDKFLKQNGIKYKWG